ncbi:hypothetical protein HNR62_000293 [Oceanisphaera litoralis]|uniref:hypothetical protein n=1 Tax=Oceanisphaera litoralis TaxID=225144 RepID=UPI0019585E34|nr:hypothetical protein [Oceanisphaera litoralis]MBM7454464.1 hypothetical protein [Oceanisphaera litoralis]
MGGVIKSVGKAVGSIFGGGGSKVNVSTPESEKAGAEYSIKMANAAGGVQGKVFGNFIKDTLRETGHRKAGSTSAELSQVAAEHQKSYQANPMAVAERTSRQGADATQAGLLAKGTAYLTDTSRQVAGTRFGTGAAANTLSGQARLAELGHNQWLQDQKKKAEKQQKTMNMLGAVGGAGLGMHQDNQQAKAAANLSSLKSGNMDLWQFGQQ